MRLGNIMRRWRMYTDMTLKDLGAILGLSTATLSRFENGENVDGHTAIVILTWVMGKDEETA